ncbi:MAG: hypothetical protein KF830_05270, partial [Planctomycetes bacterium]|nr:hypothetical protein [Planctomycetota bacterium]
TGTSSSSSHRGTTRARSPAAGHGDLPVMARLLAAGAPQAHADHALLRAAGLDDAAAATKVVRAMLAAGANASAPVLFQSALGAACKKGHRALAELLFASSDAATRNLAVSEVADDGPIDELAAQLDPLRLLRRGVWAGKEPPDDALMRKVFTQTKKFGAFYLFADPKGSWSIRFGAQFDATDVPERPAKDDPGVATLRGLIEFVNVVGEEMDRKLNGERDLR